METIRFTLNGNPVQLEVDSDRTLLWVVRNEFGLTGAKFGCGEGVCGACTVLVDNVAERSCQLTIGAVAGADVKTIEGLSANGRLHPIQEAFIAHDALQCGFCTPGMILQAYSLLHASPMPTREEIVAEMDGNLCRCGAHVRILEAIRTAAGRIKGASS